MRFGDLAMVRTYDFTTKATNSLKSGADEQPPLFPKLEDIPIVSDIYAMFKEKQKEKAHQEMQKIGRVDTSAFPTEGCTVRGRSALCSVPLNVNVKGFQYKANVTMGLRFNPGNETITESLYVDGFQRWKGTLPAATPGMCFFLKRSAEAPDVTQVIAIAPGPEEKRKLPMELAIRFDKVKAKNGYFASSLRAECKAQGAAVASFPMGKVAME